MPHITNIPDPHHHLLEDDDDPTMVSTAPGADAFTASVAPPPCPGSGLRPRAMVRTAPPPDPDPVVRAERRFADAVQHWARAVLVARRELDALDHGDAIALTGIEGAARRVAAAMGPVHAAAGALLRTRQKAGWRQSLHQQLRRVFDDVRRIGTGK